MLWLIRYVVLRRFRQGKLRALLTIMGIAAGVASLIATGAANEAILKGFHSTLDAVGGDADIAITTALSGELPEDLADKIAEVPGVKAASPMITEIAKTPDGTRLYVFGVDLAGGDETHGLDVFGTSGEMPDSISFLNDPDAILVTRRFATARGLKVGDRFPLLTTTGLRQFHVRGILEEKGVAKAYGGMAAAMDLFTAETAFGRGHHIDSVDVQVKKGANIDQVIAAIQKAIGPGPRVARPERRGRSVESMLRSFQLGLMLGAAVSLVVGLFLVFNTVSFAVAQRRREIGTLRAIGVRRRTITALFAFEAGVYGVVGSTVGLGLGTLLARATVAQTLKSLNGAFLSVNTSDASVPRSIIALGIAMGILGAVVAALVPASEAARVPPVDALRRDLTPRSEPPPTLLRRLMGPAIVLLAWPLLELPMLDGIPVFGESALAVIAFAAALSATAVIDIVHRLMTRPVTALFGAPGRIALAGLVRARRRSGVAAGAVLIGLALVICLSTFVGSFRSALTVWIDRTIPADLFLSQGASTIGIANTPMEASVGDELLKIPGIADVRRVRLVWTDFQGLHVGLYSYDWNGFAARSHPMITMGNADEISRKLQGDALVVSDNLARRLHLHVGDHVELATTRGPRQFEVAGAMVDYSSDRGIILLDRAKFIEVFGDSKVDSFDIYLQSGTNAEAVRQEIEKRLGGRLDARVTTNAEFRKAVLTILDQFFSLVYVLLFIGVGVGVLGVVGTLLAQVLDRTRELGIIRATGGSRGQVIGAVAIEAGLLGMAGAILGVPSGMLMGEVFVRVVGLQATGWLFPTVVPWGFACLAALVSIAFASVGGLLPARRAARLNVVEAIGYE